MTGVNIGRVTIHCIHNRLRFQFYLDSDRTRVRRRSENVERFEYFQEVYTYRGGAIVV